MVHFNVRCRCLAEDLKIDVRHRYSTGAKVFSRQVRKSKNNLASNTCSMERVKAGETAANVSRARQVFPAVRAAFLAMLRSGLRELSVTGWCPRRYLDIFCAGDAAPWLERLCCCTRED